MKHILKLFIFSCTLMTLSFVNNARAASPYITIVPDWHAANYASYDYQLRARTLPVPGSTLTLSFNLFTTTANTNGTLSYVAMQPGGYWVTWSVNGTVVKQGQGLASITYTTAKFAIIHSLDITARVTDPKTQQLVAEGTFTVPFDQSPEVTVHQMVDGKILPRAFTAIQGYPNQKMSLYMKAYSVNVLRADDVNYYWLRGQTPIDQPSDNPEILAITLPNTPAMDTFRAVAQNAGSRLEFGSLFFTVTNK